MNFKNIIEENGLFTLFKEASIGLEKEGQRVLDGAIISKTPHPKNMGNRQGHPYIQTDFAESQVELITSPEENAKQVLRYLSAIHEVFLRKIPKDEYIWPLSVPSILPKEEDITVAQFDNHEDVAYREYLVSIYGKYKQMLSGIHYNFGFTQTFINKLVDITKKDEATVRNNLYMKLARQFIRYQYILIYLYGATPIAPKEYFNNGEMPEKEVRSLRVSKYGYVNGPEIQVPFDTIENYAKTLRKYVDEGKLIAEKEFYSSVRFRGANTVLDLPKKGISYLEFRLFDINPFAEYGILEEDIRFIHLFAMYLVWIEELDSKQSIILGEKYTNEVSLDGPLNEIPNKKEAVEFLNDLLNFAKKNNLSQSDINLISDKLTQLEDPNLTIGGQLWNMYLKEGSMTKIGMTLAKRYKKNALDKYYSLTAFKNMELSTQALISDAIAEGINVEILDENDQFLKLSYKDHVEYVKNGNMTKHDSYISPLIMENKVVTKKVLNKDNFRVPESYQIKSLDEALELFETTKGKPLVIKPKSTNYGLGITIFKNGINDILDFKQAIHIALKEDKEVMIEEFITGTEYRFFVLNGETKAVLLRVPANVIGDGVKTIEQLVQEKNENPLRGDGLSSPLKKITLGEIELLQLKEQNFSKDTILEKGQVANLRANSNISTGGDSIDVTDLVNDSYKKIAAQASQTLMAKVSGIDMMIDDITKEASKYNYGIIEANFNPMMMMHIYPEKGQSRRLTEDILKMLFPGKYNK